MSTASTELVLPDDGPTTTELVKVWLRVTDSRDDDTVGQLVDAVNSQVRTWPVASAADGAAEWPAHVVTGATMLAARLFRRRNSPGGVEAFGQDGAAYVMRTDPDVAQLLGLGGWSPPVVG